MKITDEDIEWIRTRYRDSRHSTSAEKMEMLNILSQCMAISKREVAKIILGSWMIPDDEFQGIDFGFYGEVKVTSKIKDRHAKMLEFYNQGLSDAQIAQRIFCTTNAVKYWRQKNGIKSNDIRGAKIKKLQKQVHELYKQGLTGIEIAARLGIHRNTANYYLRKEKNK